MDERRLRARVGDGLQERSGDRFLLFDLGSRLAGEAQVDDGNPPSAPAVAIILPIGITLARSTMPLVSVGSSQGQPLQSTALCSSSGGR
jgi:hypothetical protein